jgi:hypothetical protein
MRKSPQGSRQFIVRQSLPFARESIGAFCLIAGLRKITQAHAMDRPKGEQAPGAAFSGGTILGATRTVFVRLCRVCRAAPE